MNDASKMGLSFLGGAIIGSVGTYLAFKFKKKDIYVDPDVESDIKSTKEFTFCKPPIDEVVKKYEPVDIPEKKFYVIDDDSKNQVEEVTETEAETIKEEINSHSSENERSKRFRYPQQPRRLDDRELNQVDTDSFNVITYMVTEDDILTVVDDDYNIISEEVVRDEMGLYDELRVFQRSDEGSAGWVIEPVGSSDSSESIIYIFDKSYSTYYEITGIDYYNYHE